MPAIVNITAEDISNTFTSDTAHAIGNGSLVVDRERQLFIAVGNGKLAFVSKGMGSVLLDPYVAWPVRLAGPEVTVTFQNAA